MTTPADEEMDLLVAYALNTIEPEETDRVRRLLEQRPDLRATLVDLRTTLDTLPRALPEPTVPADLRERVLGYATGRSRVGAPSLPQRAATVARRWVFALGGLSGALALIIALLTGQLATTQDQLASARTDLERAVAAQQQVAEVVAQASSVAELTGDAGRGSVLRTNSGDTLLAAQLPPLAEGRVYQLWLIGGDGVPVSGGTFTVNERGYGVVAVAAEAQSLAASTFAVTDEPGPNGSDGPTTTPLIVGTTTEA